MNIETFRTYCLRKKGVTEEFPFDEQTLAFKVSGKIFAITDVDLFESVNLKCSPEKGVELREQHESIKPGYHMNKKHWITVSMDQSISLKLMTELIDDSYNLVVQGLTKSQKLTLGKL